MVPTVFLLSPASCAGKRTDVLLNPRAGFPLAERLRAGDALLGEVFSFLSGLYFRGKLGYARAFAAPPPGIEPAHVITTHRGLLPPDTRVGVEDIRAFAAVPIESGEARYTGPLLEDARCLRERAGGATRVVLLGSIATGKYTDVLLDVFDGALVFPEAFIGRGDMSRGGLMLRCIDMGDELEYVPVRGAVRRGTRPPKLEPRR